MSAASAPTLWRHETVQSHGQLVLELAPKSITVVKLQGRSDTASRMPAGDLRFIQ